MAEGMVNCDDASEADVVLMSAQYDVTSSFGKGADKGPQAILKCLNEQIESFERMTRTEPSESLKIAYHDLGELNALPPEEMVKRVAEEYEKLFSAGKFVILLGGEHSVSNGSFQAIARAGNPQDVTILQIDAHLDLREDDTDYNPTPFGRYAHSAVMRRAFELGFRIVPVGVRTYSREEYDFAKKNNIKAFEWGAATPSITSILEAIPTQKVYITIDVDGIDPSHLPATGTPVQGGLSWWFALKLLERVLKEKEVIAADIVEVAPRPNDQLTEYGAAQLCYNIIAGKMVGQG